MASESEQERRETLADIVAEMRTRSREVKEAFGGRPDGVENMLDIWADRIEAAWKRQEKTYLDQIRDAMNMWGHEKHIAEHAQKPTVGNAAEMREALENIAGYAETARCHTEEAHVLGYLEQIEKWANAALSAPPRNCDVGTAEEQFKRYLEFCHSESRGCKHCRANMTRLRGTSNCDLAWAQTPYKAEEGGAS